MNNVIAIFSMLIPSVSAAPSATLTLNDIFKWHSREHGISEGLLKGICTVESGLNKNAKVIMDGDSPSYGLCMVKLSTARMLGFKGTANELMSVYVNVKYAAKYLKYQMKRYNGHWKKAVTAYNRGSWKEHNRLNNSYVLKVMFAMEGVK